MAKACWLSTAARVLAKLRTHLSTMGLPQPAFLAQDSLFGYRDPVVQFQQDHPSIPW